MHDITERLERALADAPAAGFDVADVVGAGRRQVRRRRVAAAGGGLAVVLALGGLATSVGTGTGAGVAGETGAAAQGPGTDAGTRPATGSGGTPMIRITTDAGGLNDEDPVAYDAEVLKLAPGWSAEEILADPMRGRRIDGRRITASVAVSVRKGDEVLWSLQWAAAERDPISGDERGDAFGYAVSTTPDGTFADLGDWAAVATDLQITGGSTSLVSMDDDDRLTGIGGVRVVEQRRGVYLEAGGRPVVAARLDFGGGPNWMVVERTADGEALARYIRGLTPSGRTTMDDVVAYLRTADNP